MFPANVELKNSAPTVAIPAFARYFTNRVLKDTSSVVFLFITLK